jgi:hypothetical protein
MEIKIDIECRCKECNQLLDKVNNTPAGVLLIFPCITCIDKIEKLEAELTELKKVPKKRMENTIILNSSKKKL